MHIVKPLQRGDAQPPGVLRTISGRLIDLRNPKTEDIDINDIAWSLSKQIRYNGHIPYDYTVARHSVIMSYFVPPARALEALLHDAGEAYCGDIIYPIKIAYPEMEELEDGVTGVIMNKYNYGSQVSVDSKSRFVYRKSASVEEADKLIAQHECSRFGRPGQFIQEMHNAERQAESEVGLGNLYHAGMVGDREAFLNRFYNLQPGSV